MFNKAIIEGFIGKDAELKATSNGNAVATFSVATDERFKNKAGEKVERTTWHNVVVWGKAAESLAQYLTKGKRVIVEGKISNRSYEKKDGAKGYVSEIIANNIVFLGSKGQSAQSEPAPIETEVEQESYPEIEIDEEIPF
jgi:single-strand DNA-binding protein